MDSGYIWFKHCIDFLKYSPGLELNPFLNWTRINLSIQIEKLKSV